MEDRGGRPAESGRSATARRHSREEGNGEPAPARRAADMAECDFRSLGLSAATLAAVDRAGYTVPTPVQAGLIPRALQGIDVLGQARTGTGKTAAFVLPIL